METIIKSCLRREDGVRTGRKTLIKAIILAWAASMLLFSTLLMAGHTLPLPKPSPVNQSGISGTILSGRPESNTWKVIHVLVAGCPCSAYTAQTLATRHAADGCVEEVLLTGGKPDWEDSLVRSGFLVKEEDGEELHRETGIAGGPWLLIVSPSGEIKYSGGYAAQRPRPGVVLQDQALLKSIRAGKDFAEFPAFGCAATAMSTGVLSPAALCRFIQ